MSSLRGLTPLAIFLLLGLAVFALDGWRDGDAGERTIVVTEAQLASIREQWAAQWDRPPTDEGTRSRRKPSIAKRSDWVLTVETRSYVGDSPRR